MLISTNKVNVYVIKLWNEIGYISSRVMLVVFFKYYWTSLLGSVHWRKAVPIIFKIHLLNTIDQYRNFAIVRCASMQYMKNYWVMIASVITEVHVHIMNFILEIPTTVVMLFSIIKTFSINSEFIYIWITVNIWHYNLSN